MAERKRRCDVCNSFLVAQPRAGETDSNKEWSIEYKCPNTPHEVDTSSPESEVDIDELREIGEKYGL